MAMWCLAVLVCVASQFGPRVVAKKSQLDFNAEESRKILSKYFGKLDAESYDRLGPSTLTQGLRSMSPEDQAAFAKMMGFTTDELQGIVEVIASKTPEEFRALQMASENAEKEASNDEHENYACPDTLEERLPFCLEARQWIKSRIEAREPNEIAGVLLSGTPLHAALHWGFEAAARELIELGADVDAKDGDGDTPMHFVAMKGIKSMFDMLIARGADVDAVNFEGFAPLHHAAANGHVEVAEALIAAGADPEPISRDDYKSPYDIAMEEGHTEVATLIDEAMGRPTAEDAAVLKDKEITDYRDFVIMVRRRDARSLAIQKSSKGVTTFKVRCSRHVFTLREEDPEKATKLLQATPPGLERVYYGEDDEMCSGDEEKEDEDPMELQYSSAMALKGLMKVGMSALTRDKNGNTALHYAARTGFLESGKKLISLGADVDALSTRRFERPLHLAAWYDRPAFVSLLLENGAGINARTSDTKETPLHFAARGGSVQVVRLLIERGASLDMWDADREIPLEVAADDETKEVLMDAMQYDWAAKIVELREEGDRSGVTLAIDELARHFKWAKVSKERIKRMRRELRGIGVGGGSEPKSIKEDVAVYILIAALAAACAWGVYRCATFAAERAAARREEELIEGDAPAPAPRAPKKRAAKTPRRRDARPRRREQAAPAAPPPAREEKLTPASAPAVRFAAQPAPEPATTAPVADSTVEPESESEPEPAPEPKAEPTTAAEAAPLPAEPSEEKQEAEAPASEPVPPRGYELVSSVLKNHGRPDLLPVFVDQCVDDQTLQLLNEDDLSDMGLDASARRAVLDAVSALGGASRARGAASKKLATEDLLDGAARHQARLEETLRSHREEIARLRLTRGEIPEDLRCPLTLDLFCDPVTAADGHTYERVAIEEWFATGSRTSPTTNEPLQSTALIPQHTMKKLVCAFMDTRRRSSVDEDVT